MNVSETAAAPSTGPFPHCLAVIGAGVMGTGIAAAGIAAGLDVVLIDSSAEALSKGATATAEEASRLAAAGLPSGAAGPGFGRLRTSDDLAAAGTADVVIESIVEKIESKHAVFRALDRIVGPRAVLASNTSTYPIRRIAEAVLDPSRVCGIHFFVPVERRPLVEVVRGVSTHDQAVNTAVALAGRIGKRAVVVRDSPGFLVNRVLMPYLHEAVELLREGVPIGRIDAAARAFGMPVGPLELYDLIGLDTAFYAGLVMHDAFGDRIESSPVVPAMVRAKWLGRKSGVGFFHHTPVVRPGGTTEVSTGRPNEAVATIVERYASEPHRVGSAGIRERYPESLIIDRLFLPMVLEATLALDEGVAAGSDDVDLAVVLGLGFPAARGGLMRWAASLGAAALLARLEPLAPLGPRMRPTPRLLGMAAKPPRSPAEDRPPLQDGTP
jgi:3-hydroxyacyl-CoA dehydrogenase/enoyl-CoA hydratase/3-hydroxybutyryl-CoA epimerase/3-hydroxyacyl-CoA dehydrogenase/enoyl-CoA hydratase/3-hydroxybutyryl-CoA epimerase/enoyl-CoA isomerase